MIMKEDIEERIEYLENKLKEFDELIEFSKKVQNDVGYAKWLGSRSMLLSEINFLKKLIKTYNN